MTREDAIKILAILKAAYPNSYKNISKDEANGVVAVWTIQFAKYPADIVYMAVNKAISSCKFPPSICEVKDKLTALHWEAQTIINSNKYDKCIDEKTIAKYRRIYELTQSARTGHCIEPTLYEMMNNNDILQLGG